MGHVGVNPLTFLVVFPFMQEIVTLIFLADTTLRAGVGEAEGVAAPCVILIAIFGDEK